MRKSILYLLFLSFFINNQLNAQQTRYVTPTGSGNGDGSSWVNASNDLQSIINESAANDSIFVAKGTYQPTASLSMADSVKIYGNFSGTESYLAQRVIDTNSSADSSIIDGSLNGGNTVFTNNNLTAAAVLDGFEITGGNTSSEGSGMFNNYSSPTINNCSFTNNTGTPAGGGMFNNYSSPTINNCSFTNNTGITYGGGMANFYSFPTINNCSFVNNTTSRGGGIFNLYSSPIISNCSIEENMSTVGGGIYNWTHSSPIINNCSIMGNSCDNNGAGILNNNSSPIISNCNIAGNISYISTGGGIYNQISSPIISNCNIAGNISLTSTGGGIYNAQSSIPLIKNCIIYDNSEGIADDGTGSGTISSSIIQPNSGGSYASINNINADPLFVNAPAGNYNLLPCSPAINMGDTTGISQYLGNTDLAGNNRYVGTIDMGAYEYNGFSTYPTDSIPSTSDSATIIQPANDTGYYVVNCDSIIAKVVSNGANPIANSTTAYIWVENAVPAYMGKPYVARHYQITPAANASTATATITLYFTQADFDNYNAATTGLQLPAGSSDNIGIGNLRIVKYSGVTNDNSGLMGSYSNGFTVIDPADSNIVWNSTDNRWQVSFDVTSFSGFFVQAPDVILPVTWLNASAKLNSNNLAVINWKVQEQNVARYQIEQSINGSSYATIGTISSKGNGDNNYSFTDNTTLSGNSLYRIKQIDKDGNSSYSAIMQLQRNSTNATASIYPNPANDKAVINMIVDKAQSVEYRILDNAGKVIQQSSTTLNAGNNAVPLNVSTLASGMYYVSINGQSINTQLTFIKN